MSDLTIIEQRTVTFYDDEFPAVVVDVGGETAVYVLLRPICDFLSVSWNAQFERVRRDEILSELGATVCVTRTEGERQVERELFCLPLDSINGWLFGINASRVKPEVKERLLTYQRECYRVLADAFQASPPSTMDIDPETAILEQLYAMSKVITYTTGQMLANRQRLDKAAQVVKGMDQRLRVVEQRTAVGPLTNEQAQEVKRLVNAIAFKMSEADPSKSHFQAIYAALADETGAPSYKQIPPKGYETAVAFLASWLASLAGDDALRLIATFEQAFVCRAMLHLYNRKRVSHSNSKAARKFIINNLSSGSNLPMVYFTY